MIKLREAKKRKKKTVAQKLQAKAESLWKEIALLRDGYECQVLKNYPEIDVVHTDVYQVDHAFSRSNKNLFLDLANSTVVCSSCNMLKGYDAKAVDVAIHEIVRKREGDHVYERMKEIAMSRSANVNWNNVMWLEDQVEVLENIKTAFTAGKI